LGYLPSKLLTLLDDKLLILGVCFVYKVIAVEPIEIVVGAMAKPPGERDPSVYFEQTFRRVVVAFSSVVFAPIQRMPERDCDITAPPSAPGRDVLQADSR
jgi:hypothetical protein